MEVLSILLKNPYHHSLPHAIPVHMMNGTYQVISFDGSTTIEEFHSTLAMEIACRDATNGFTLFSDDPIEKDLEHYLDPQSKVSLQGGGFLRFLQLTSGISFFSSAMSFPSGRRRCARRAPENSRTHASSS
jgi:hypothetical protein